MNSNRYSLSAVLLFAVMLAACQADPTRAILRAREAQAISRISTLHQAEVPYYTEFNHHAGLPQLGPPAAGGTPGPDAAGIIPANLAGGKLDGFVYTVTPKPDGYAITAVPSDVGAPGARSFYSDQTLVLRYSATAAPADANSPELR
jgi:hypothetical protein